MKRSWRNEVLGLFLLVLVGGPLSYAKMGPGEPAAVVLTAPLSVEQVVKNLEQRNLERAQRLRQFEGSRLYTMRYRGFPSNHDADMVVKMSYQYPDKKEFSVVSQTGSKFIVEHVFKKLLEGEQEALREENRERSALNSDNYEFSLAGYEMTPSGPMYVLSVVPQSKSKFLYLGKIWVDATDFAVTRIEGEPAKNPSFWIKKTEIKHTYEKVGDFWLPEGNHTESQIRIGGRATLSIEYKDYKITQVDAIHRDGVVAEQISTK